MIEISRVIGARLAGHPKVGAKEGCTKPISSDEVGIVDIDVGKTMTADDRFTRRARSNPVDQHEMAKMVGAELCLEAVG